MIYEAIGRFVVHYARTRYRRQIRIGIGVGIGLGAALAAAAAYLVSRDVPEG